MHHHETSAIQNFHGAFFQTSTLVQQYLVCYISRCIVTLIVHPVSVPSPCMQPFLYPEAKSRKLPRVAKLISSKVRVDILGNDEDVTSIAKAESSVELHRGK